MEYNRYPTYRPTGQAAGQPPRRRRDHRSAPKQKRWPRLLRWAVVIALVLMIASGFLSPLFPEVEYVSLTATDLPRDIGTLKVVYLSDIHYGFCYGKSQLKELVDTVNGMNPDLILLGGDYATNSDSAIAFFREAPAFRARYAVCAVMGDADRTLPDSNKSKLSTAMFTAGVYPLVNDAMEVRIGNSSLWVAGVDDVTNGNPQVQQVASKLRNEDYVIFLSHNPAILAQAQDALSASGQRGWFDLGLFGHTHGGQIGFFPSLLGPKDVHNRYLKGGWFQENRVDLLISRGVGTRTLPLRLFCSPQIHVLTIKSGK